MSNANDHDQAILTALTTEHLVMQSAIGAGVNEANSRASMFLGIVSGALVAMGFATQSETIFVPFIATILPAIFVMGVFTALRLVDISVEGAQAEVRIAAIRRHYRSLGGKAETLFAEKLGRWPEGRSNPALRLGLFVAYWTSAAAMIAAIDALVAAAGVALLLRLGAEIPLVISIAAGAVVGLVLLVAFYLLQKLRIGENDQYAQDMASIHPDYR